MEDVEVKLTLDEFIELVEAGAELRIIKEREKKDDEDRQAAIARDMESRKAAEQLCYTAIEALKPIFDQMIYESRFRMEQEKLKNEQEQEFRKARMEQLRIDAQEKLKQEEK